MMLDFGVEKLFRDAAIFLHMDGTIDISRFKIVKAMFPHTAGQICRAGGVAPIASICPDLTLRGRMRRL